MEPAVDLELVTATELVTGPASKVMSDSEMEQDGTRVKVTPSG